MIPADKLCKCGHRWRWYSTGNPLDELDEVFGNTEGLRVESDTVERACPHHNGTMIEYCPRCDAPLTIWGCGPVEQMECVCWNEMWEIDGL